MLLVFLGVQLLILSIFLATTGIGPDGDYVNSGRSGRRDVPGVPGHPAGHLHGADPGLRLRALSNERSESNVDLLFISTLRPTSIVAGKLFSALVLVMLVFSLLHPFMTFTYLLRGIDIPTILYLLGMDLLAVLLSTQYGLFLASIPAPRALKVFLSLIAVIIDCWVCAGLVAMSSEFVQRGLFVGSAWDTEFWMITGVVTLAVLFATGLLFCWSVALINPPSANRALMGRLFLLAAWLILGAACMWLSGRSSLASTGSQGPVTVWTGCSVVMFCLQLLISINERESWGPRMARTIPRNPVVRLLAFLLYSGSAGGVLLSVLGLLLTLLVSLAWRQFYPFYRLGDGSDSARQVFTALALYTYCYAMTAVMIRAYLLRTRIQPVHTWVLVLLLVGLGTALPWIVAFIIQANQFGHSVGLPWWLLGNPFFGVYEIMRQRRGYYYQENDFATVCFVFLGLWGILLQGPWVLWIGKQFARFCNAPRQPPGKATVGVKAPGEAVLAPALETR